MKKLTKSFEKQIKVSRFNDNDKDSVENITIDYNDIMYEIGKCNFDGEITEFFVLDDIEVNIYNNYGCGRHLLKKETISFLDNEYFFTRNQPFSPHANDNATFYFKIRIVLIDDDGNETSEDIEIKKETSFNY